MALRSLFADTRPLTVPAFRRLWVSNIVTVIGAQLTTVAVPAQIYALTGDSSYVGLTGIFGLVPLVIFGLYGGTLTDSMDRRTLIVFASTGLAVSSALLGVWALMGIANVWLILCTLALQQAFFAVNQPARSAILPAILPKDWLPAASTLSFTLMTFGAIVGPLVGGLLLPVVGFAALYFFDAAALTVAVWAVYRLPTLKPHSDDDALNRTRPGLRAVWDGLLYIGAHRILLMSLVVDLIAMVFGMPRALFPQIAHEIYGGSPSGGPAFALLSSGLAIGATLGGLFSGWISRVRRYGRATVLSIAGWGVAIVAFGAVLPLAGLGGPWATVSLVLAVVFLALSGVADMVSSAFRTTILQLAADDRVRGRLQSLFLITVAGGPRLADVAHGFAAGPLGLVWAVAGGGLLTLVGIAAAAAWAPDFLRFSRTS